MIIPFFIPGQEKDNLDFLLNNGLAIRPTGTFPLDVVVKTLYDYPEKLERIKISMRMEKKEGSAEKIASLFEEKLHLHSCKITNKSLKYT